MILLAKVLNLINNRLRSKANILIVSKIALCVLRLNSKVHYFKFKIKYTHLNSLLIQTPTFTIRGFGVFGEQYINCFKSTSFSYVLLPKTPKPRFIN